MSALANLRTGKGLLLLLVVLFSAQHVAAQSTVSRLVKGKKIYLCIMEKDTFETALAGCQHYVKVHEEGWTLAGGPTETKDGSVTCTCQKSGQDNYVRDNAIYGQTVCPYPASLPPTDDGKPWREQMCECPEAYVAKGDRCVLADAADDTPKAEDNATEKSSMTKTGKAREAPKKPEEPNGKITFDRNVVGRTINNQTKQDEHIRNSKAYLNRVKMSQEHPSYLTEDPQALLNDFHNGLGQVVSNNPGRMSVVVKFNKPVGDVLEPKTGRMLVKGTPYAAIKYGNNIHLVPVDFKQK